jgi:hypothetical protein
MFKENEVKRYLKQLGGLHIFIAAWLPFIQVVAFYESTSYRLHWYQYIFPILILFSTFSAMYALNELGKKES